MGATSRGWAFDTLIDEVSQELPNALREECPGIELPSDLEISRKCARAIRAVVAGSENDVVARLILEAQGSAERVRAGWLPASASVTAGAVVGILSDYGITRATHRPSEAIIPALLAAALVTGAGAAWFGIAEVGLVQDAQAALRSLVDALLGPNAQGYKLSGVEELVDYPLAPVVTRELERILNELGYGDGEAMRGPPQTEVLYRWDGEECQAIDTALRNVHASLRKLRPHPDWMAPRCVLMNSQLLLNECSKCDSPSFELEVNLGSTVFHLLVCCAAVAEALDQALNLSERRAA